MKLLGKIETQLNHILALDEDAFTRFAGLSGQVISLELIDTDFIIYILPTAAGIHLQSDFAGNVNVKIRGTATDMLAYLIKTKNKSAKSTASIEVTGDVALAQDFQSIMLNIELDWEEQLAQWFGDTIAHKLGRMIRGTAKFTADSADKLQQDISEYLRFETELTLDNTQMDEFTSAVDNVRNDVERLKLRIHRLEQNNNLKAE